MNIPYKYRCKIFQQNISKWNPATYKIIIPHDQMEFIPVIQNFCNIKKIFQCNLPYYILQPKEEKSHEIQIEYNFIKFIKFPEGFIPQKLIANPQIHITI